jgi:hypothetical protein
VATGASGQFDYLVTFKIVNKDNEVKIGLMAGGTEHKIEYKKDANGDGWFWFDGDKLYENKAVLTATHVARITSEDGKVWHVEMYGPVKDYNINAVPTAITLGMNDQAGPASPVIYIVSYESAGEPAAEVTPTPTPAAQVSDGAPVYNPQQVQNFYDNIYPLIGSPYDTVTYNADGTYSVAKGYPTSSTHYVAGTVTSAADGSPITGASVVLGNALQKTDSLGKFKFEGIANGVSDIAVSADGFAAKTQSVNVNADLLQNFALDKVAAGGSTVANAENETANVTAGTNMTADTNATMPANATIEPTMAPTMAPTTAPSPTQTQSPGFEGIAAAIAMIGSAGVLVYLNRKR